MCTSITEIGFTLSSLLRDTIVILDNLDPLVVSSGRSVVVRPCRIQAFDLIRM